MKIRVPSAAKKMHPIIEVHFYISKLVNQAPWLFNLYFNACNVYVHNDVVWRVPHRCGV